MGDPGPSRRLRQGLVLTALLLGLAMLAPLLSTDRPWVARGPDGLHFPALSAWLGGRPAVADPDLRTLLRAPIPHDPYRMDLEESLSPPSGRHWLGTDVLGRDMTARVVHGARVSLWVGILAALSALVLGIPLGALAGYRGGIADAVVSRAVEAVLCFPALLLALALLSARPNWLAGFTDVTRIALVLGLTGWVPIARYIRGEFLKLRDSEMVLAARAAGLGGLRLVFKHILPCSLAPVLITAAFAVAGAMALEAALSFLGLGVRPPVASWGGLMAEAREQIDRAWWLAFFPGFALALALLASTMVGEGLRDLLDPKGSGR